MTAKKNWFVCLAVAIFEVCIAYAIFSGILHIAGSSTYPFLWYGLTICILAAAWAVVHIAMRWLAARHLFILEPGKERQTALAERAVVACVVATSAVIRLLVIGKLPITPSSDYQTYYQVAELLVKGSLGASGYSGYIAQFPHVIGYPFILSLLFRITGPSVQAGLYLNAAASLFNVFLTYRIARSLCGRLGGLIALFEAAFWPSQILYGAILGSEAVFTCLLLLSIWLFIYLYRYPVRLGNRESAMFLCVALGILIALANAVRPLSMILLIAAVLCIIPFTVKFDNNEKMLNGKLNRASCQGWFISLIISVTFLICSSLISASISQTIAYKLPGSSVSFGYNLMVGVNIEAKGAWNQQDAEFFSSEFASKNSPEAAHRASADVAFKRISSDPVGVLNLSMEKFTFLWSNDDYGKTWTTLFLEQQGGLTPERADMIRQFSQWNDWFYLLGLFFSFIYGLRILKQKNVGPEQALILLVVGTVALHLFLETQNRYHYFILPVFMILSAMTIAGIYRDDRAQPKIP